MIKSPLLKILYLILIIGFILFFFFGPDYHSSRSFKTVWDQGHIFFYTIFMIILLHHWRRLSSYNIFLQYTIGILIALITGIPIELLQAEFARIPEMGDVWRDILGCLVGITFFSISMNRLSPNLRWILRISILLLIIIELTTPAKSLTDEIIAERQFPLISGFETSFETDRWTADTGLLRSKQHVYDGKYSASVVLTRDRYSRLSLVYFPRDWHNYQFLQLALYNSSSQDFSLVFRIHDGEHIHNNQEFHDRYNRKISILSGWNLIILSLEEVESAPRNRKMNLKNIYDLTIFSKYLSDTTTIFIDDVKLIH